VKLTGTFFVFFCKKYYILIQPVCDYRFSAEETPYMVDSAGVVRLLSCGFNNTWVPVANLKQRVSSSTFLLLSFHFLTTCVN